MRTILAALFLGAALPGPRALPAATPGPADASFRVGGVEFQLPLPSGYCLPRGLQVDVAQLVAAGDSDNVTDLTLFPCSAPVDGPGLGAQNDYVLIKTPKPLLIVEASREEVLRGIGEAFENPAFTQAMASGQLMTEAGKDVGDVLGAKVDLSGDVAPRGKDDVCAYLGGTMAVQSPRASYTLSVGACVTAVGGRMLTIYWYGPDQGPASVARLLIKVKGLAQTIKGGRSG
jgi:hypothetical protein